MTKCIECAIIADVDGPVPNKPEKAALGMNNIDSPPGKIVETFSGGGARRNDGKELIPAADNRWYVLATVVGEQEGSTVDSELHCENRRFWNGWMCQDMGDAARRALAKTLTVSEEELEPLNEEEAERLHHRFDKAFPTEDLKPTFTKWPAA